MSVAQHSADSWGAPAAPAATPARRAPPTSNTVRDDWDDDDDEHDGQEQDPQKVWEEANKRAPMPELVMAGSSTSNTAVSPPPTAFQPVLRILKRPTPTPTSSSSPTPTPDADMKKTYAAREALYQAARERIFGESSPPAGSPDQQSATSKTDPKKAPASVQIAREPKGPPAAQSGSTSPGGRGQGGDLRGFGARRGKRRGGVSGKP